MHVTLPGGDLARLVGRIRGAVPARTTIPILGHIHLTAADGLLTARGTSLDVEMTASVPATVAIPGTRCIPADVLGTVAARLDKDDEVTLAAQRDTVKVSTGRSRYALSTLSAEDFPASKPVGGTAVEFESDADALRALLAGPRIAMPSGDHRSYLNGIHLAVGPAPDGGGGAAVLLAVSTDGHKLIAAWMPCPDGAAGLADLGGTIIVPRHAVPLILDLLKAPGTGESEAGQVSIQISASRIAVERGGTRLVSQLVDGTFPDWRRVVPQRCEHGLEVEPAEVIAAATRLMAVHTGRGHSVALRPFAPGGRLPEGESPGATITAAGGERGASGEEAVAARVLGAPRDVGVNAAYLAELLGLWPGEEPVTMTWQDAGSPIRIERAGVSLLQVVMPMRI